MAELGESTWICWPVPDVTALGNVSFGNRLRSPLKHTSNRQSNQCHTKDQCQEDQIVVDPQRCLRYSACDESQRCEQSRNDSENAYDNNCLRPSILCCLSRADWIYRHAHVLEELGVTLHLTYRSLKAPGLLIVISFDQHRQAANAHKEMKGAADGQMRGYN